jgi:hypothetical protein
MFLQNECSIFVDIDIKVSLIKNILKNLVINWKRFYICTEQTA